MKMTQRLPHNNRQAAILVMAEKRAVRKLRITFVSGFFLLLTWFLLSGDLLAQTDTELGEEEAAEVESQNAERDFDFFGDQPPVSITQLREMQEHFQDLARDVTDATVSVQVGQNQGTGVIVTRDGYVMTAAHVIGGANRKATIKLPDGTDLDAITLGLNRTVDSGLLKISQAGKYPYLNPGVSEELKNGQWVMAIGHPGGWEEDRGLVFRVGRITRQSDSAISTDCTLVGGDSGGPLVDMDGNVIAIHSRIGAQVSDNIHVPVDVFSDQWDDLSKGRDWGRGIGGTNPANEPWLGLGLVDSTMTIESVVPDGPADKAGIKVGDVMVAFGDERVPNQFRFRRLVRSSSPGDKLTIKIKRDEEELEIELTVGSRADIE